MVSFRRLKKWIPLLLFAAGLHGQTVHCDQPFVINTYRMGNQYRPQVTSLTNGGFLVSWRSQAQVGPVESVHGRFLNASMAIRGDEFEITTDHVYSYGDYSADSLPDGKTLFCWTRWDSDSGRRRIFRQFIGADGMKIGSEAALNDTASESLGDPRVFSLGNGRFTVLWASIGRYNIQVRLYDSNGEPEGPAFIVNPSVSEWKNDYQNLVLSRKPLCRKDGGGYLLVWEASHSTGEDFVCGLSGQLLDSELRNTGGEFLIRRYEGCYFPGASAVRLSDGGILVVWTEYTGWYKYDVFGQMFDASGSGRDVPFQINADTSWSLRVASVTALKDGGFFTVWSNEDPGGGRSVWGRLYGPDNGPVGMQFRISDPTVARNDFPAVAQARDGRILVAWEGIRWDPADTAGFEVYASWFPDRPVAHPLSGLSLIGPSGPLDADSSGVRFRWRKPSPLRVCYPFEIRYDLYVDTDSLFSRPIIHADLMDTVFQVTGLRAGTVYFWKVRANNIEGDSLWNAGPDGRFIIRGPDAGWTDPGRIPADRFHLHSNYPNPFNPSTSIRFDLASAGRVRIAVYDLAGRLVRVLLEASRTAGEHAVRWNGLDAFGKPVPSGIYVCRMEVRIADGKQFTQTVKMGLVR
jgi:hypothetical protein